MVLSAVWTSLLLSAVSLRRPYRVCPKMLLESSHAILLLARPQPTQFRCFYANSTEILREAVNLGRAEGLCTLHADQTRFGCLIPSVSKSSMPNVVFWAWLNTISNNG